MVLDIPSTYLLVNPAPVDVTYVDNDDEPPPLLGSAPLDPAWVDAGLEYFKDSGAVVLEPPNPEAEQDPSAPLKSSSDSNDTEDYYFPRAPLHAQMEDPAPPPVPKYFRKKDRESFELSLDDVDKRIRVKLNQPFGKDDLSQCFYLVPSLRHVLLPLWKSGFFTSADSLWTKLEKASPEAQLLTQLILEYGSVDFSPLQEFPSPGFDAASQVDKHRVAMITACLLSFDGSAADAVRYIGGTHVGAHRDTDAIITRLRQRGVTPSVVDSVERILRQGISQSFG